MNTRSDNVKTPSQKIVVHKNKVTITPENNPKIKYKEPMSLWLVENNHRKKNLELDDTKFISYFYN